MNRLYAGKKLHSNPNIRNNSLVVIILLISLLCLPHILGLCSDTGTLVAIEIRTLVAIGVLLGLWIGSLPIVIKQAKTYPQLFQRTLRWSVILTVLLFINEFIWLAFFQANVVFTEVSILNLSNIRLYYPLIRNVLSFFAAFSCGVCLWVLFGIESGRAGAFFRQFCIVPTEPYRWRCLVPSSLLCIIAFIVGYTNVIIQDLWLSILQLLAIVLMGLFSIQLGQAHVYQTSTVIPTPLGVAVTPFLTGQIVFVIVTHSLRVMPTWVKMDHWISNPYVITIIQMVLVLTFAIIAQKIIRANANGRVSFSEVSPTLSETDNPAMQSTVNALPEHIVIRLEQAGLTGREVAALAARAAGLTSSEHAALLGLSPSTVREQIRRAAQKLGVSIDEAVRIVKNEAAQSVESYKKPISKLYSIRSSVITHAICLVSLGVFSVVSLLTFGLSGSATSSEHISILAGIAFGFILLHAQQWASQIGLLPLPSGNAVVGRLTSTVLAICGLWIFLSMKQNVGRLLGVGPILSYILLFITVAGFVCTLGIAAKRIYTSGMFERQVRDETLPLVQLGSIFIAIVTYRNTYGVLLPLVVPIALITAIACCFVIAKPQDIEAGSTVFESYSVFSSCYVSDIIKELITTATLAVILACTQLEHQQPLIIVMLLPLIMIMICYLIWQLVVSAPNTNRVTLTVIIELLSAIVLGLFTGSLLECVAMLTLMLAATMMYIKERDNSITLEEEIHPSFAWHNSFIVIAFVVACTIFFINMDRTSFWKSLVIVLASSDGTAALETFAIVLVVFYIVIPFLIAIISKRQSVRLHDTFGDIPYNERVRYYLASHGLNQTQIDVALLTAQGKTIHEISSIIHYSTSMVSSIRREVYSTLGVQSAEALRDHIQQAVHP